LEEPFGGDASTLRRQSIVYPSSTVLVLFTLQEFET